MELIENLASSVSDLPGVIYACCLSELQGLEGLQCSSSVAACRYDGRWVTGPSGHVKGDRLNGAEVSLYMTVHAVLEGEAYLMCVFFSVSLSH
jgi:hypothetical protein